MHNHHKFSISHSQQLHPIMIMNKNKTLYFRKTHKLLIQMIALRGEYHFNYSSLSFANSEDIVSTTSIQPNKIIEVTTIDVIDNGKESLDSEVTLDIHLLHSKIKHLIGRVSFDLKREKVLNPNSSEFYKKTIKQGDGLIDGYIQYKFVAMNTSEISEETFNQSKNHKNSIEIEEKSLQISQEYKKLLVILTEKDAVIKSMEEQINRLMVETKRLNTREQEVRDVNKLSPISLSIHMKPSTRMENEHKRLIRENQILKIKLVKFSETVEKIEKEKRALHEENILLKEIDAAKLDGETKNASVIIEKRAFIEELKKSVETIGKDRPVKQIRVEDLPEYSQIHKKVQEETEQLRAQLKAVRFDDVNIEKDQLIDKLKRSIKEIDLLKHEIEEMQVYIHKLTDELKILRKNTSSEGIMAKIEAIRSENQKTIEELKRQGNAVVDVQAIIYRSENYQIENEMLKKDKEDSKNRFDVQRLELDKRHREDQVKIIEGNARQAETAMERDSYKLLLDDAKASLEKYFSTGVTHDKIGQTTEQLSKQFSSALKLKETLEKNLTNEKAAFATLKQRYEKSLQQVRAKNEEIQRLRSVQVSNKAMLVKLGSQEQEIKGYQKKYNELRSMARSLDTAFRRKQNPDQKYSPELLEKLQNFELMVRDSQKGYLNSQLQALQEQKNQIIEDYYNNIKKDQEKIDADENLAAEQKKLLKQSKEQELARIKDSKLAIIESRIAECIGKKSELEGRLLGDSLNLPLRLATLEKSLRESSGKFQTMEMENQELKRSIAKMKGLETVRVEQIDKLKESNSKLSGSGLYSGVQINTLTEGRQRFMDEFNRISEDTKRRLNAATKENSELKKKISSIEGNLQRQRIEFVREHKAIQIAFKEKEHQLDIENLQKKNTELNKTKKIETQQGDIAKLRGEKEELQLCCNKLEEQLQAVSRENDTNAERVTELTADVQRLHGDIVDCEKAMDEMKEIVEEVRREEQQKVMAMEQLMEERADTFVKIEKVKDTEIAQLKRLLRELEEKAEEEIYEAIRLKEINAALQEQVEALQKERNSLQEALILQEANLKKELRECEEKAAMLEQINQEMEKQMLTLAEEYQKLQEEAAMSRIHIDAMGKEKAIYDGLERKMKDLEETMTRERAQMNYVIKDKRQELQKYSTDLLLLQERLKMVSEENQKVRQEATHFQAENERLKEKVSQKSMEMIALAEQKSIISIEKARKEGELEETLKRSRELEKMMDGLRGQLAELKLKEETRYESDKNKIHRKESQLHHEPRISHHVSIDELVPAKPPAISIVALPEKPKELEAVDALVSLGKIAIIEEEPLQQLLSQSQQQPEELLDNLETRSARSQRSDITHKSALSRTSRRREHYSRTPEMVEVQDRQEREVQLLRTLNEVEGERDELLIVLTEMKQELETLRQLSSGRKQDNIKIDDTESPPSHSATFSLSKANFLDSRELNNTHEATEKDHSKEMHNYELTIEELERERDALRVELEQQRRNVENLIKASEELQADRDELIDQLEEARRECQERSIESEEARRDHEQRVEELIAEIMQKEEGLAAALKELEDCQERLQQAQQEECRQGGALEEKEAEVHGLRRTIHKIKTEYRKYQEEAELEILTLREKFDELTGVAGDKNEDIRELVEKYLSLEEVRQQEADRVGKIQGELGRAMHQIVQLQQDNGKIGIQRQQFTEARKKLSRRVHELEVELLSHNEKLTEAGKATTLLISKGNIREHGLEQQLVDLRARLQEKDRVVLALKNEIALYNEQCAELKRSNDDLDYQLQRATKEVKDIMLSYEQEFDAANKEKLAILESTKKYDALLSEKEKKLNEMRAEMRQNQRERVSAENELKDIRDQYERYKSVKGRQLSQKCTDYELKNNELETLKLTHGKLTKENSLLEGQLEQERSKGRKLHQEYRDKMSKYQECLEEVSKELVSLADRPSKEAWQQALFDTQLFRSRVEELQEEARKRTVSTEDQVAIQFRKYKVRSETVIRNLEQEMESYSGKVNELEEANYYLKRESEALRTQLNKLSEVKYELDEQIRCLEDDVSELREEVEFYKGRRRQELTKLLNDTDD